MKNIKTFEDFYFMDPDKAFKSIMSDFKRVNVKLKDNSVLYLNKKFNEADKYIKEGELDLVLLEKDDVSFLLEKGGELYFYNRIKGISKKDSEEILNYFNNKYNTNYKELNFY